MIQLLLSLGHILLNFKSLISSEVERADGSQKLYTKLLAFGIRDFSEAYRIIEKFKEQNELRSNKPTSVDKAVYEHLSQKEISESDFNVKHILALTFEKELEQEKKLSKIENIFPHRTKVSSMVPGQIHFGPLEGFLSGSFSNINIKTLVLTISFWMIIYGIILYYLYF